MVPDSLLNFDIKHSNYLKYSFFVPLNEFLSYNPGMKAYNLAALFFVSYLANGNTCASFN